MTNEVIKLEVPLFYNNEFGLRFEIGSTDIGVWEDYEKRILNNKYFDTALDRSMDIFQTVFAATDSISIAYQIYSHRRKKIKKGNYLFKQINDFKNRKVIFTKHREIYPEDLEYKCNCWRRVTITDIKTEDVNIKNILLALIHSDFSVRKPSIMGQCFFINHTKGITLNLYDDRGMDIVALEKSALVDLYKSHYELILDYDRKKIDNVFSQI